MKGTTIAGLLLVALGVAALVWGGFSFTEEEHAVELGPVELAAKEKERVEIPTWLGVTVVAGGVVLLVAGRRR